MITPSDIRQIFPEFTNAADYPDAQIQFWIDLAYKMMSLDRWDDLLDQGVTLFVAHHLALARREYLASLSGGAPGAVSGIVTSKSVDKVSVSYDVSSVGYAAAGFWNMTTYGIRYWRLITMVGAGGIQL
jgi:hypothetical protein